MIIRYLSLFSGIGCDALAMKSVDGPVSFECVGFSEVDAHAIKVYRQHYPKHRHLGPIQDVTEKVLRSLQPIDLVIGGSPCQGFSRVGKQKRFEDPRSKLFWDYVRVVKSSKARWFLLENVGSMKMDDRKIITEALGTDCVRIKSSLLTAQTRNRLYWANFPITAPADAGILLSSVVRKPIARSDSRPMVSHGSDLSAIAAVQHDVTPPFAFTLKRTAGMRGISNVKYKDCEHFPRTDGKSNACICAKDWTSIIFDGHQVRYLYIDELEQLQGLPRDYTLLRDAPKQQREIHRRKLIGNGFTVPVITHILKCLTTSID